MVNKFTLGADESTRMSDASERSIFVKYVNSITNTLCERLLCLVPLGSSKSASALHEAIGKVLVIAIYTSNNFNTSNGTNTISSSSDGL